jgi:hypothetical protein
MAATLDKTTVTLGGIELAGNSPITWKLVTGTQPYTSVFQVHHETWQDKLVKKLGQPLDLVVTDSRGVKTTIRNLYILHAYPSDSPHRKSFVVADRRWKWAYQLIVRDYNISRRTGSITLLESVPSKVVTVDEYDFKPYSINGSERWNPKAAVEDILNQLEPAQEVGKKKVDQFRIDSFPIDEGGEFSLQNVLLRDQGDAALARMLSYVPGSEIYVDVDGTVIVFDGTDLAAAEKFYEQMPPKTWDGDQAQYIDRKAIRPKEVHVFYEREVEALFEYHDDYEGSTSAPPRPNTPFMENVVATPDVVTANVEQYVPDKGLTISNDVAMGTWVTMRAWLKAMDENPQKPAGPPWNFTTIATHWMTTLEGVLAVEGADLDDDGNVAMRVEALRKCFRQCFRISQRYVERLRDIKNVRVALLHPVTGTRGNALVWSKGCIVLTTKGKLLAATRRAADARHWTNVNYYPDDDKNPLSAKPPGPWTVSIIDRDQGIISLDWVRSPFGTDQSFAPSLVVNWFGAPTVPSANLADQDRLPVAAGCKIESGANGIYLAKRHDAYVLLTIVPAAPNNKNQFHREVVKPEDIDPMFANELRIQDGEGPILEVFIPPGELTARFGMNQGPKDHIAAAGTIVRLLGLDADQPNEGGIDSSEMEGYYFANHDREILGHARAVAAEAMVAFADALQGNVAGRAPDKLRLVGNIGGVTIQVAGAPSAKVSVHTDFPGRQKSISRLAIMPHVVRTVVLGILPTGKQ